MLNCHQRDEYRAAGEGSLQIGRDFERQTRLAGPARTGQGNHPYATTVSRLRKFANSRWRPTSPVSGVGRRDGRARRLFGSSPGVIDWAPMPQPPVFQIAEGQRIGERAHGLRMRTAAMPRLERADRIPAQPGPFRQFFLGKPAATRAAVAGGRRMPSDFVHRHRSSTRPDSGGPGS